MKTPIALFIFFIASITPLVAQDTLLVMTYNLLGYPSTTGATSKNANLSQIAAYLQPDILACQEMETNVSTNPTTLLNGALNVNGVTHYAASNFAFTSSSNIGNMLYYNTNKLALKSQHVIPFPSLREMNHYRLYYLSADLATTQDTVFVNVIVIHLKASSGATEEAMRQSMATTLMNYLNNTPIAQENTIVLGDANIYHPTEPAFQTFTNYSNPAINFIDPLASLGLTTWNNNPALAPYCTQSTRLTALGDGGATGGMDDRFDILLPDADLTNGTAGLELVPNSCRAVGQDGLRFNSSLISPTNNSAPSNVINALYYMSDHLPVVTKFAVLPTCTPPQPTIVGSSTACLLSPYTYTVTPIAGHTYQWSVSANGTIVSGQGTTSLTVVWNNGVVGTVAVDEW